jgi:hypothetical protein
MFKPRLTDLAVESSASAAGLTDVVTGREDVTLVVLLVLGHTVTIA